MNIEKSQQIDDDFLNSGMWAPDSPTRVKICGITKFADAILAVEAGADMLGFNFYRHSPRYIEPHRARAIISELSGLVVSVGVFVNEPSPEAVALIADRAGVAAVQLHGDETPEYCLALEGRIVIKALRVKPAFDPLETGAYQTAAILLDGYTIKAQGGTGETFDWEVALRLPESVKRLFLAGGLGVDNVREAVARIKPFAVDACSRLESRPGVKDPELVARFVREVRAQEADA
jgi:phosphoribosylanthranilate isomerase